MSIFVIVLFVLSFGIFVGLASKKLSRIEFIMVGAWGIMLGTTSAGLAMSHGIETMFSTVGSWFG